MTVCWICREDRVELLRRVYPATDIRPLDLFPSARNKRIWDLKINHLDRAYDVVGVFNFDKNKAEQILLKWKELGLPDDQRVHVFDFWNKEYLGDWPEGMVVDAAPTSCRVLTLLPDNGRIQLISTSRHITQGWVDLTALDENKAGDVFTGTSNVVKNDPYELRFVFPRGTNYLVKHAVARAGLRKLPVQIFNHQGWAAVRITSPKTGEIKWEVQFAPGGHLSFSAERRRRSVVRRAGLDGVNLHWQEQYYLNAGYQVYLNGQLLGYTPTASFPDPQSGPAGQLYRRNQNRCGRRTRKCEGRGIKIFPCRAGAGGTVVHATGAGQDPPANGVVLKSATSLCTRRSRLAASGMKRACGLRRFGNGI